MATGIASNPHDPAAPSAARRWFAFLGGAVAWTVHLLSIYAIAEFGCVGGAGDRQWLGVSAVTWMIIATSLVLLIVSIAATLAGYRDARPGRHDQPADLERSGGDYLSHAGWMFSAVFALIILFESIPALFYLDGC